MKKLILSSIALILLIGNSDAQTNYNENIPICPNLELTVKNFKNEEMLKGEFLRTEKDDYRSVDYFKCKITFEGFEGEYVNHFVMGPICKYRSINTYGKTDGEALLTEMKAHFQECIGRNYYTEESYGYTEKPIPGINWDLSEYAKGVEDYPYIELGLVTEDGVYEYFVELVFSVP